ncbi:MAG: DNA alkylation repair protein [Acidobacteriota bacterium]|nr:DNA alkylation repair protein [Acidobacteriota bacterium]
MRINKGNRKTDQVETLTREILTRVQTLPSPNTSAIRNVRRQFSKRMANAEPQLVLELALRLIDLPGFEFRFIAYELVQQHRAAFSHLDAPAIEKLGKDIDSWVAVDCFACYLAGPAWRERQINDSVVRRWSRSKDRWWRRAALVATVPLNNKTRGGSGDPVRTLDICRLLMGDRDPMVVKAMSWALRELAKRNPHVVREFLRKEQDELAPQVVREVDNKLATGLKNPRKGHKPATVQN